MAWSGRWSNSSLTCAQQCGERFRRRYLEGEWQLPNVNMLRGSATHEAARVGHRRQIEVGVQLRAKPKRPKRPSLIKQQNLALPSSEEIRDIAADDFDGRIEKDRDDLQFQQEEQLKGGKLDATEKKLAIGEAKDFVVKAATIYNGEVAPLVNPVGVEHSITATLKSAGFTIKGIVDLIDEWDDGEHILDLKTSKKSPNKNAAAESQALSLYGVLRKAETGKSPILYRLRHLVKTPKATEVKVVETSAKRTDEQLDSVLYRLGTVVDCVERGIFMPADPMAWWCGPTWCEFWKTCRYSGGM